MKDRRIAFKEDRDLWVPENNVEELKLISTSCAFLPDPESLSDMIRMVLFQRKISMLVKTTKRLAIHGKERTRR
jgi:hypothetical protein